MVLLNYIVYHALYILLPTLMKVKSQTTTSREGHTATFINNKLYILGGANIPLHYTNNSNNSNIPKETFFYIDFSASFDTSELKWIDLTNVNNIIPSHELAAAIKGGANKTTLFLYDGISLNSNQTKDLVYIFDVQNNTWSIPTITGMPPSGISGIAPIVDYDGLMYLYGGIGSDGSCTNDMFILDTVNLNWKKANSTNAPSPRTEYSAVLLPNQNIMYMGM